MYASYIFYTSEYLGDLLTGENFDRYAKRASAFLDYYTLGKAAKNAALPQLKQACCALAEKYYLIEAANRAAAGAVDSIEAGQAKASETVGSYSVTYRSGSDGLSAAMNAADNAEAHLAATARMYLANTGLLYRGRGCC